MKQELQNKNKEIQDNKEKEELTPEEEAARKKKADKNR